MKNKLIVAILAFAALVPLTASAEGIYVGASVGRTQQELKFAGSEEPKIAAFEDSLRDAGMKLVVGKQFDKNWGIESGLAFMGRTSLGGPGGIDFRGRSVYLAGTGKINFGKFAMLGKLGLVQNYLIYNQLGARDSVNETDYIIGVGVAYHFTEHLSAVLEYERYGMQVKNDEGLQVKAQLLSTGMRYKF